MTKLLPTKHGFFTAKHGFFDRLGGQSLGIYKSLNLGFGSHDDQDKLAINRQLIEGYFNDAPLFTLYQSHSNRIYRLQKNDSPNDVRKIKADGLITNHPNQILGILTADCLPILFEDADYHIIGACHAGWKGCLYGVIENMINDMRKAGAKLPSIHAVIGVGISGASYEVDLHFKSNFLQFLPWAERYFKNGRDAAHFMLDLKMIAKERLIRAGISSEHIGLINDDSYANDQLYFSYRRATHKKEQDYGRQISAIML